MTATRRTKATKPKMKSARAVARVPRTTSGLLAWHVHHDKLCERLTEPIESRIECIRDNKPKNEIDTRLRLLKVVKDQARAERALKKYNAIASKPRSDYNAIASKAWSEYNAIRSKAQSKYNAIESKARYEYDAIESKAWSDSGLDALHKKECKKCPWDGKTIFPKKEA